MALAISVAPRSELEQIRAAAFLNFHGVALSLKPKACQIRLTVIRLSPVAFAKPRVDQWVSPRGVLSKV
jgi:hypothetical protein